jgi:hypothetical protein
MFYEVAGLIEELAGENNAVVIRGIDCDDKEMIERNRGKG